MQQREGGTLLLNCKDTTLFLSITMKMRANKTEIYLEVREDTNFNE